MDLPDTLPALRPELKFIKSSRDRTGNPVWLIYDPIRHRYYHISKEFFSLLASWSQANPQKVLAEANRDVADPLTLDELGLLFRFLSRNQLLLRNSPGNKADFLQLLMKLVFFRIPLWSPQLFLDVVLRLVQKLNLTLLRNLLIGLAVTGVLLLSRQGSEFLGAFSYLYSWQGWACLVVGIVVSKVFHEMGHGLIARYYHCQVNSCGIAFMAGFPLLYVDISDGWRVDQPSRRALISAGGILGELVLAILCIWLWLISPDGVLRTTAHAMVTVTLVSTLLINLNPLGRFDGYFLLADRLNITNLQDKSYEMGKWFIRRLLLGWRESSPVTGSRRLRVFLILFAYLSWLWRLVIFLGLAWLAYSFFIKPLGVLLMFAAVGVLLALPLSRELSYWWRFRDRIRPGVALPAWIFGFITLVYFTLPIPHALNLPAVLQPTTTYQLFTSQSARLSKFLAAEGNWVAEGQTIAVLEDPGIDHELALETVRLESVSAKLDGLLSAAADLADIRVLEQERLNHINRIASLRKRQQELVISAPFAGTLTDIPLGIKEGMWVQRQDLLGTLVDGSRLAVWAAVPEAKRLLVPADVYGTFYPENSLWPSQRVIGAQVESVPILDLNTPYQMSLFGGQIPVIQREDGSVVTVNAIYRADFELVSNNGEQITHYLRGTVRVKSLRYSMLVQGWRRVTALFIRESGF